MQIRLPRIVGTAALFAALPSLGFAADTEQLANELANPIANLATVPIEYNLDSNIGPSEDGEVWSLKFTPVYPVEVNDNWNLISRAIFSYVDQDLPDSGINETGWSDLALSLYFTPKVVAEGGIIWGVGPVLLFDTATEDSMGTGRYGAGPAAVALKQSGPWTIGGLVNYVTDVGGDGDREDIESAFFQPFLSYTFNAKWSMTLQSEITRDLENDDTSAFALFQVNRMFRIGSQIMQWRLGVKHWYEQPQFGPDSTEINARLTFLFPK